jgi:hypothetical protein
VVEHFHGKEGVSGSIPEDGSVGDVEGNDRTGSIPEDGSNLHFIQEIGYSNLTNHRQAQSSHI